MRIASAIKHLGPMGKLKELSMEQIRAIAEALQSHPDS